MLEVSDVIVVKLEQHIDQSDIDVIIKYGKMNPTIKKLVTLIQSVSSTVKCSAEDQELWVDASDIFYIESVDKRTFVYCKEAIYRSDLRLYQLAECLGDLDFVQISKACILNINYLKSIRALLNSRMEATLSNGEKVNVTRKFLPEIKAKLLERQG